MKRSIIKVKPIKLQPAWSRFRSVILPIAILNGIMFFFQAIFGNGFTEAFLLNGPEVWARPWILVTSMFLHANLTHLFFNMYALIVFGPFLESKIGPKRFFWLYMGSGIIAGVLASFFYPKALGASGAIMGMLGAMIILLPNLRLLFLFFIPMSLRTAGIIWAFLDTVGIFFPMGIGNIAHLAGMGVGLLYGLYLKDKRKQYNKTYGAKKHFDDLDIDAFLRDGKI
ncbi:MAG: rhomboid family intramembrane serine protease [Nanoarchaeota archaeon]|nr:rhomboid family intramembrane serine protease [Nanoarchaeota archaeon]